MAATKLENLKIGHIITSPKLKGKYIVIKSFREKQYDGHSNSNWYTWKIDVQKLKKDGSHSYKAKVHSFYPPGGFIGECTLEEVDIIGKMKKVVIYVEEIKKVRKDTFV